MRATAVPSTSTGNNAFWSSSVVKTTTDSSGISVKDPHCFTNWTGTANGPVGGVPFPPPPKPFPLLPQPVAFKLWTFTQLPLPPFPPPFFVHPFWLLMPSTNISRKPITLAVCPFVPELIVWLQLSHTGITDICLLVSTIVPPGV